MYQTFYSDSIKIQNAHDGSKFTPGRVLYEPIFSFKYALFELWHKNNFWKWREKKNTVFSSFLQMTQKRLFMITYSQTSRAQSKTFTHGANTFLTGLHFPIVSIPPLLPSSSSIFPLDFPLLLSSLRARELEAIIAITYDYYTFNLIKLLVPINF